MKVKIGQKAMGKRIVYDEWVQISGTVTEVDEFIASGKPMANITVKTDEGFEDWFGDDSLKRCPHCGSTNIGIGPGNLLFCYNCDTQLE